MTCAFQAPTVREFAPISSLRDDNTDRDTMITSYSTTLSDTANKILGVGAADVVGKSHMPQEIFLTSVGRVGFEEEVVQSRKSEKGRKTNKGFKRTDPEGKKRRTG